MRLRFHYAWVVVIVTFLTLLFAAGVRTIPSVIIKPLEADFGWDRGSISFAVALSLFAYGFGGPISGSLIDRFGPRRVMLAGLGLTLGGLIPLTQLSQLWELHILWGIVIGIGTGAIANVLAATVANRWYNTHRGLAVGLLGASVAVGQLIFIPLMISITGSLGWRVLITLMCIAIGAMLVPVFLLMRDRPEDVGLEPVGGKPKDAGSVAKSTTLREAIRTRDFWLLAGSFFICGYTTNGLIGTHLLPHTAEHGFIEVETAGALSIMGFMNIFGTLAQSGFRIVMTTANCWRLITVYAHYRWWRCHLSWRCADC